MDSSDITSYTGTQSTSEGHQHNTTSSNHIINSGDCHASASIREWLWFCCNCGMSVGQKSRFDHCEECQHEHCKNCPWESVEIDVQETSLGQSKSHDFASHEGPNLPDLSTSTAVGSHLIWNQSSSVCHNSQQDPKLGAIRKRRRKQYTEPKSSTDPASTLACHFNKRFPERYNPWANGDKYLKCLYPNPCQLRHIVDHLKFHFLSYYRCQGCYAIFQDENGLLQHEEMKQVCSSTRSPPSDGIDLRQRRQIEDSISTKKNPDKSKEQRWFDIWEIIYPGVQRPQSPYSAPPRFEPTLLAHQDIKISLQLEGESQPQNERAKLQGRTVYLTEDPKLRAIAQAEPRQSNVFVCIDSAPFQRGELDRIPPSEPHSTKRLKPHIHNDALISRTRLSPPTTAKSPISQDQGARMTLTPNLLASQGAQTPTAIDTRPVEGVEHIHMDSNWSLEDLIPIQGTDIDLFDPGTQLNELVTLFPYTQEIFPQDSCFPAEGQLDLRMVGDIERDLSAFLSYELEQPGANGPIEDWRDMNKGLNGRYEFNGTM